MYTNFLCQLPSFNPRFWNTLIYWALEILWFVIGLKWIKFRYGNKFYLRGEFKIHKHTFWSFWKIQFIQGLWCMMRYLQPCYISVLFLTGFILANKYKIITSCTDLPTFSCYFFDCFSGNYYCVTVKAWHNGWKNVKILHCL